ncbi:MAG: hypothetical protein IIX21_00160 [Clostridia bacterium]|nr:hypothetical protein [Clostridia bacterium]MEE0409516.1 hypothetical protein [Clostridia bacterium]
MLINIVFFIAVLVSVVRTVSYGIYTIKNKGIIGGISIFVLALTNLFTVTMILCKQILQ